MPKSINKIIQLTFILLAFSFTGKLYATHIIGGSMTYKYIGPGTAFNTNNYEFTLTMYRDCSSLAEFDNNAAITIYEQIGDTYSLFSATAHKLASSSFVPLEQQDCMTIPNVCVEKGTYIFKIELPINGNSFHISYSRCCRNATINNLVNPKDIGATYSVELTNAAMIEKNSSPAFTEIPPIAICNEIPIFYDHSAIDIDGDLLIYSFTSPLLGGGPFGDLPNTDCAFYVPFPGCPPPYELAPFVQPQYTPTKPMGGDPIITIQSTTGLITGTTHQIGQYVVTVSVKEYRAGKLMSIIRREFQFNVTPCQFDILAKIKNDSTLAPKTYQVSSCSSHDIQFINQTKGDDIKSYYWEFDLNNGQVDTSTEINPLFQFPSNGQYTGILIAYGELCNDTIHIQANVGSGITAIFNVDSDSCASGPVRFKDVSVGESPVINWTWNFGNGTTDKVQHPNVSYLFPGDYPVSLKVEDSNGCIDDTSSVLAWYPAPKQIIFQPSTSKGCGPTDIQFTNLTVPLDSTYKVFWDFGDSVLDTSFSPTHFYQDEGYYSLAIKIQSPLGCEIKGLYPNWIQILPEPKAQFSYEYDSLFNTNVVHFYDESEDAVKWFWNFDSLATKHERDPSYTFEGIGKHLVHLRAVHESGCIDTITKTIDIIPEITFFMPNAFTPNEDTKNDIFKGVGVTKGIKDFRMAIWNRWGEQVFQTTDVEIGWNGNKNNLFGQPALPGVYIYEVQYTNPRGKDFFMRGFATLIR